MLLDRSVAQSCFKQRHHILLRSGMVLQTVFICIEWICDTVMKTKGNPQRREKLVKNWAEHV